MPARQSLLLLLLLLLCRPLSVRPSVSDRYSVGMTTPGRQVNSRGRRTPQTDLHSVQRRCQLAHPDRRRTGWPACPVKVTDAVRLSPGAGGRGPNEIDSLPSAMLSLPSGAVSHWGREWRTALTSWLLQRLLETLPIDDALPVEAVQTVNYFRFRVYLLLQLSFDLFTSHFRFHRHAHVNIAKTPILFSELSETKWSKFGKDTGQCSHWCATSLF